ncbi:phosphodiester glycosidase family protein [Mucisphaera calidilacus]|uniref:Phosphodiester glycosidase domain-containing protein n=1 Tax=Mucisphaera calidilacus TaxID=2527982 RepID=A0A518C187_9BACT|nr:phosphodiester glycosidase family protein [Mucisphaera calidilacus]QDU72991.1 hypothetical protein Pan265_28690 [Mucisphaera calidilacus]
MFLSLMRLERLAACLCVVVVLAGCRSQPAEVVAPEPLPVPESASIRTEAYFAETADGPIRGYLAWVDLTDPALEVITTSPLPEGHGGNPAAEASNQPTNEWAQETGAVLAINANFYAFMKEGGTDILGLSVNDGVVVSPPREVEGYPADPAVAVLRDGTIYIGPVDAAMVPEIEDGVAGVGGHAEVGETDGLLVTGYANTGATARVAPARRHPRTAVGTDASGRTLIIAVIDGRRAGWSIGVTLPELAEIMIDAGAMTAINLDGGGSSSFYFDRGAWLGTDEPPVTNMPSDAKGWRSVANHLGIRVVTEQDNGDARD